MDFRRTLAELAGALAAEDVAWALMGGVALGFHGVVRATFDIDILVEEDHLDRLDRVAGRLGYDCHYRWEESSHWRTPDGSLCPLDVLHARRAHTRAMLRRSARLPFESDLEVPVLQPEDLIGLKVQAMVNDPGRRRSELVDVRELLEISAPEGRLDLERVREYFALFAEEGALDELLRELGDADA